MIDTLPNISPEAFNFMTLGISFVGNHKHSDGLHVWTFFWLTADSVCPGCFRHVVQSLGVRYQQNQLPRGSDLYLFSVLPY